MTITKADREAAARILSICDRHYSAALVRNGRGDDDPVLEELVAHREAERRAIVEWLRAMAEPLPINGDKRHIIQHLADAIERGEDRT